MSREEIFQEVRQVISENSTFRVFEIKAGDNLSKFISAGFKDRLAGEIKRSFRRVNATRLTNQLYDVIKKVNQLVAYIDNIYNPQA